MKKREREIFLDVKTGEGKKKNSSSMFPQSTAYVK